MRNTKQRNLILGIVSLSTNHLTAEEIYEECIKSIPKISLGTVYRNLNFLVDLGYIKRIKMPNNIDRFDKNIIHSHIICNKCGKIADIFGDFNIKLPILKQFQVYDYELCFNGICNDCIEEEK